jgi:lipoprotein signal peptidase
MPVFNIADILVTFGVIGLIFTIFKEERVWKK